MRYASFSITKPLVGLKGTPPWFKTNVFFLTEEPVFLGEEEIKRLSGACFHAG